VVTRAQRGHNNGVIARLVRTCALGQAIQYSETAVIESIERGVLDSPAEPVIGLAEGETRWRGMTAVGQEAACHS
jgi:hypothetical protein